MKSVAVATLGLFAALASALDSHHNHIRHLHFPRSNATTTAGGSAPTTLTVYATQVHTVISCAPTVTNCPARNHTSFSALPESAKTTVVVTDTVVIATTVCPVAEASSIASSLMSEHSSGKIPGSTLPPAATTAIQPSAPGATNQVPPVTTATAGASEAQPTGGNGGSDEQDSTSTTTATKTSTVTITLTLNRPTATGSNPGSGNSGNSGDSGNSGNPGNSAGSPAASGAGAENCSGAPTVTVTVAQMTVTVPASTVYVTVAPTTCETGGSSPVVTGEASPSSGSGNSGSGGNGSGSGSGSDSGSGSGSNSPGSSSGGNSGTATTDCSTGLTTTIRATVTVMPYPMSNSTTTAGGMAGPSGFARLRR